MTDTRKTPEQQAEEFAYEYGRRTIPLSEPARKFSRPDPDLFWGLKQGYLAGYRAGRGDGIREAMEWLKQDFGLGTPAFESASILMGAWLLDRRDAYGRTSERSTTNERNET